jgi:hypothetical protein
VCELLSLCIIYQGAGELVDLKAEEARYMTMMMLPLMKIFSLASPNSILMKRSFCSASKSD